MLTTNDRKVLKFIEEHGAITIKIAARIFYPGKVNGYDDARKRLKRIYDMRLLKRFTDSATDQLVYYIDKKLGPHRLKLLEFYAMLTEQGAEILEFKPEPCYCKGRVRGDGFFDFIYAKKRRLLIVEIDYTSARPLERWEVVYKEGEIQKAYKGAFPSIVLVGSPRREYKGESPLNIVNLDFEMHGFVEKILTI